MSARGLFRRLPNRAVTLVAVTGALLGALAAIPPTNAGFTSTTASLSNSWAAAASCFSGTPVWATGFEPGVVSAAGGAVTPTSAYLTSITGSGTLESNVVRSGSYSLKVTKASGGSHYVARKSVAAGGTQASVRFAIRFQTLPTANVGTLASIPIAGSGSDIQLRYILSSTKLGLGFFGASETAALSTVVAGRWYVIDIGFDVSANPNVATWRVDGTNQTTVTKAQAADTLSGEIWLGSTTSGDVFTAYYDDVLATASTADYPLPDGRIDSLAVNAYVGKNDPSNRMQNDAGTAVAAGSQTRLADLPMTSLTTYIRQTNIDAAAYAEYGFEDVTRAGCVNGVSGVVAAHSSAVTANVATTKIREGGTDRTIHADSTGSGTAALQYRAKTVQPASGSWSASKLTGTTTRIGYASSVSSLPYWDAVRLEYDQTPNASTDYPAVVAADSPIGYWRLGDTSGTTATATAGANGTYTAGVNLQVGGAVGDTDQGIYVDGNAGKAVNISTNSHSFPNRAPYTTEIWARDPSPSSSWHGVAGHSNTSGTYEGWGMQVDTSAFVCERYTGGAGEIPRSSTALLPNVWYHLACVYDGSNLRVYVNGALETTMASTRNLTTQAISTQVGFAHLNEPNGFIGAVDEFAVYDTALSTARILAHYDAGKR